MIAGLTYSDVPTVDGTQSFSIPTRVTSDFSAMSGSSGGMHRRCEDWISRSTCFWGRKSRTWPSRPRVVPALLLLEVHDEDVVGEDGPERELAVLGLRLLRGRTADPDRLAHLIPSLTDNCDRILSAMRPP